MSNILHISYAIRSSVGTETIVAEKLKMLGFLTQVHPCFWRISSKLTAEQMVDALRSVIGLNDSLYVADITNNAVSWHNLDKEVEKHFLRELRCAGIAAHHLV